MRHVGVKARTTRINDLFGGAAQIPAVMPCRIRMHEGAFRVPVEGIRKPPPSRGGSECMDRLFSKVPWM
jgi:hypothetical protein